MRCVVLVLLVARVAIAAPAHLQVTYDLAHLDLDHHVLQFKPSRAVTEASIAADGAASHVELVPWSVVIAHEDVQFRSDSAVIDPGETEKLDASLAQIDATAARAGRFMKLTLYIAGHTDTVGPSAKNRTLSLARAVAIGAYLRDKGVTLPIVVAGFGEDVPRTRTPDNTDARVNRRADYVLGPAGGTPPFRGAYLKAHAAWKPLPR